MVVMTAKVDKKKIMVIVAALLLVIVLISVFARRGGSKTPTQPNVPTISTNEDRVQFLTEKGWTVSQSPVETQEVRIPEETTAVYERYNALQVSQGYDLSQYAGKNVMRYVYEVTNYPAATEPVYATLLVYKGEVIGGDVTSTAADGTVHGFNLPSQPQSVN